MNLPPQVFVSRCISDHPTDCACVDSASDSETDCTYTGTGSAADLDASTGSLRATHHSVSSPHSLHRAVPYHCLPLQHKGDSYKVLLLGDSARGTVVVVNEAAEELLDWFSQPREPEDFPAGAASAESAAIRCLARVGALQSEPPAWKSGAAAPRTIVAWLHLTDQCNLRCAYCYASALRRRSRPISAVPPSMP